MRSLSQGRTLQVIAMNYKSLADLNDDVACWIQKMPTDFDIIVGIPRSGLLVANLISLHFNIPLTDVENLLQGLLIGGGLRCPTKTGQVLFLVEKGEAFSQRRRPLESDGRV